MNPKYLNTAFGSYLAQQIDRAIYVWGAQGENVLAQPDPYGWILAMEKNNETNAKRAYNLYLKRKSEGISPILAYDCSGLIVAFLLDVGILKADRTAAALYSMCDIKMDNANHLMPGDFVCHYNATKGYITHIGVYVGDGKVIEAKGRDYGVVETDLDGGYDWNRFGRLTALAPYLVDEPVEPMSLAVCKPVSEGQGYALMQEALNALGYTDSDGKMLTVDGKWGKKSRAAWDKAVRENLGTISCDIAIHIEGIGDITKEDIL